jgi:hypothetical protein
MARQVCKTIYQYDELSDKAKEIARKWWIDLESQDYAWVKENTDTLKAFENLFPVQVNDWEYGNQTYVNFQCTCDEEIERLSGWRLAKYLWNNYGKDLFKGKYYSTYGSRIDGKHHYKSRHSKIILDHSCVLTGYYMDDKILDPVYKFLESPDDSVTFYDLMNDCLQSWVHACEQDYEYALSDENAEEFIRANEYEFNEDGTIA